MKPRLAFLGSRGMALTAIFAVATAIALFTAAHDRAGAHIGLNEHSVAVTPNTDLNNNDTVSAAASAFTPGEVVIVIQCNPLAVLDHMALGGNGLEGCSFANQVVTSADGSGDVPPTDLTVVTGELQDDAPDPIDTDVCPPTPAQEAAGAPHCTVQVVAPLSEHGGVAEIAFSGEEGVFGAASCSDTVDNDGDGPVDADDPDCQEGTFCIPSGPNFDGDGPEVGGTGAGIGNGTGIPGDDATVPNHDPTADNCDGDDDNDGLVDGSDGDPRGDNTYDDDSDGSMAPGDPDDDGPSWDVDANGVRDGAEGSCPLAVDPDGDDDGDGLLNTWEVCKWGTDPADFDFDTDGDGTGDCVEVCDVNGDSSCDFVGDVIAHAKAALVNAGCPDPDPSVCFGQDGDFDINGDGSVDFVGDVIQEARFGLIPGLCR